MLFEDRRVEALYLHHAKSSWGAKAVPPLITGFALLLVWGVVGLGSWKQPDNAASRVLAPAIATLPAVAGFVVSCAQRCHQTVQYQLRGVALGIAVYSTTLMAGFLTEGFMFDAGFIAPLALLWVCQKVLVISDVVAARALVPVAVYNSLPLLTGVFVAIAVTCSDNTVTTAAKARVVLELVTSVLACSGVLIWLTFRNEAASRTVFYWNRIVVDSVQHLDAEANPFHHTRLLNWLSEHATAKTMTKLSSSDSRHHPREFWELDSDCLHLHSKIAAGGGGLVWHATYKAKDVAAKQLFGGLCTDSAQIRELAKEVSVLAQLSHVNIVRFLGLCHRSEVSQSENNVYLPLFIVQEYCPFNLRGMLTDTFPAMPVREWQSEVRRVAMEIARAMEYLHNRSVLHRDLKPENILLTQQRTVRLADFGISVEFVGGSTCGETTCGTPAYMSPELLCARLLVTRSVVQGSADVYAYGVILSELLHSNKDTGDLAQLFNCNRKLAAAARSEDYCHVDLESEWQGPSFGDVIEPRLRPWVQLGQQCCAFHPSERPSFAVVCRQWAELGVDTHKVPADVELRVRSRSISDAGTVCTAVTTSTVDGTGRSPLSVASIRTTADATAEYHRQFALGKCSLSCWIGHHLQFADTELEGRFTAFLHSDIFFQQLRAPYIVLATMQLAFTLAMFGLDAAPLALYPATCTALFGAAAVLSCVRGLQRFSMITMTALALLAALTQCATAWAEVIGIIQGIEDFSNVTGNATSCWCNTSSVLEPCAVSCSQDPLTWQNRTLLLPLLHDLTTPVTLLVLGLPFYLYVWLLTFTAVSWVGTTAAAWTIWLQYQDLPGLLRVLITTFPGLALFPICTITAIAAERLQRQMFRQLCGLRAQESHLLERATFRGYRDALHANWRFLAATNSKSLSTRHVVTAATI